MRALFTIFVLLIAFLWLVSKCSDDKTDKLMSEYKMTDAERKSIDSISAVEAKNRILEEEQRVKDQAIADKKFYKSKAGRIHKKHPDWSREDCERLADNRIWIGMDLAMLKYKRGLPDAANPSNYGGATQWQWCWHDYTPSCFYDNDEDGKIDSYN